MWHMHGRGDKCTRFWWKIPKEREFLVDVDGSNGAEWNFGWGGCGVDSNGSRQEPVVSCRECDDERSDSGATLS
jgi:hypothetical protein